MRSLGAYPFRNAPRPHLPRPDCRRARGDSRFRQCAGRASLSRDRLRDRLRASGGRDPRSVRTRRARRRAPRACAVTGGALVSGRLDARVDRAPGRRGRARRRQRQGRSRSLLEALQRRLHGLLVRLVARQPFAGGRRRRRRYEPPARRGSERPKAHRGCTGEPCHQLLRGGLDARWEVTGLRAQQRHARARGVLPARPARGSRGRQPRSRRLPVPGSVLQGLVAVALAGWAGDRLHDPEQRRPQQPHPRRAPAQRCRARDGRRRRLRPGSGLVARLAQAGARACLRRGRDRAGRRRERARAGREGLGRLLGRRRRGHHPARQAPRRGLGEPQRQSCALPLPRAGRARIATIDAR